MGLVAHTGGFGWDEALIFAVPVVILAVLQFLARRRARVDESAAAGDGDEGDGAG